MSDDAAPDEGLIDYAAWGRQFFLTAVTTERILGAVNAMAGQPIAVGPIGVGPGRVAKVTAKGSIGTASGERIATEPVAFAVRLPARLEFSLDLGVDVQRFTADIEVPLRLTVCGRSDLAVVVDVDAPTAGEVMVRLRAKGLRASITQHAANVEGELKRFVARYVAREVEKPGVQQARVIDVGTAIERAAGGLAPRPSGAEQSTRISSALAEEIQEHEDLFIDDTQEDQP